MKDRLQLLRGDEADRKSLVPLLGEPIYTVDERRLYLGDGMTAGGRLVYAPWDEPYSLTTDPEGLVSGSDVNLSDLYDHYNLSVSSALTVHLPPVVTSRAPRGTLYAVLQSGGSLSLTGDYLWEHEVGGVDPTIPSTPGLALILRYSFSPAVGSYLVNLMVAEVPA